MDKDEYLTEYILEKRELLKQKGIFDEGSREALIDEFAEIKYFDMAFDFIREYLNPLSEIEYTESDYDKFSRTLIILQSFTPYYYQRVADEIQHMPYKMFLMTPYWKLVSEDVKLRFNYTCKLCGSRENLQVHHITYDNHGFEHKYRHKDLICVCEKCHKKLHNIK